MAAVSQAGTERMRVDVSEKLRTAPRVRRLALPLALRTPLVALALFLLALAPRALAPATFLTIDEAFHWFERSAAFLTALQAGDFAATNQTGHPGVTTMWLGALGLLAQRALIAAGLLATPDGPLGNLLLRLPVAIATSLAIALAYPLLRRLLGTPAALLAVLLWAGDPFLVAHSKILHLDALLASLMTLALLAALVAFVPSAGPWPRRGPLAASALASGLALLTKSPAALLPPLIVTLAFLSWWRLAAPRPPLRTLFVSLGLWGSLALLAFVALWPALWVDPQGALGSMLAEVRENGGVPHQWNNFFMGRTVADPGPLFYPVAVALRLTPWTLGGLLLAPLALRRWGASWPGRTALPWLALFALLFVAALTVPPKKFDRYILAIFPTLDIIAACGLLWLGSALLRCRHAWRSAPPRLAALAPLAILGLLANLAWYHPYQLAYYNPLLGGGPVAARSIGVGWGEGHEQAGAFIVQQPDGCQRPVATWMKALLQPYICSEAVSLNRTPRPGRVGYAVLYINQIQTNNNPNAIAALYGRQQPVHTVRILGIDYAYIYRITPPDLLPLRATFGSALSLRGYSVDTIAAEEGTLTLQLQWQASAPPEPLVLFVHMFNERGERVAQIDVPLAAGGLPPPQWPPGATLTQMQQLPLPPGLPAGSYRLALGVYRPADLSRLPLRSDRPADSAAGADALLLDPFVLRSYSR